MSTTQQNEGYKSAFRATSLFGGVQVITILIGVIRSKLIAIWLGTFGFGILSLFNSAIQLISSISNLGLASSAVREISQKRNEESKELSIIVSAINKWVFYTGIIGLLFTIFFSKPLSLWIFDSDDYTISFIFLSAVILFTGLTNGYYAILQGMQRLEYMAKARIYGSFFSALLTLPLFYIFKEKGIVSSIILTSLITFLVGKFYVNKAHVKTIKIKWKQAFDLGLPTVRLGIMMAISAIMVVIVELIVKSFIIRLDSTDSVGLYQAGWTINASYLGLVFTAMATDYFPRLCHISNKNIELNKKVNEQAEIAILVLAPMISIMILFLPLVVRILYTKEFIDIVPMTKWLLVGSLIKAGSWAISFIFLAKGDGKIFLLNELVIKLITIPSYLFGYYYWGLDGIGYAFMSNYIIYFIWVSIISYKIYKIRLNKKFWIIFCILLFIILSFSIMDVFMEFPLWLKISYLVIIITYSIIETDKRIGLRNITKKYFKKKIV